MIDLDDQLTAYREYLDDTERRVVVLRPARLDDAPSRRRRFVAFAAAAVVLAGAIGLAAIVRERETHVASFVTTPDEWSLVPDVNGAFEVAPDGRPTAYPNSVTLNSVAHTAHGWVAVGTESRGPESIAAVWTSIDGTDWERLPDEEVFRSAGDPNLRSQTSPDGPSMIEVGEYDGTVVVAGVGSDGEAVIWRTDDLVDWRLLHPFPESIPPWLVGVAAGDGGFVAFGGEFGLGGVTGWHSLDGENWTLVSFDQSDVAAVNDVIAVGDGFVAVGLDTNSDAAAWSSPDGSTWRRSEVVATSTEGFRDTYMGAVASQDGHLVGFGGGEQAGTGSSEAVAWTSANGLVWTAHQIVAGLSPDAVTSLVATDDEFISLAFASSSSTTVEWRSADGVTWTNRNLDLLGFRSGADFFDGTAVAVGESSVWILHTD